METIKNRLVINLNILKYFPDITMTLHDKEVFDFILPLKSADLSS